MNVNLILISVARYHEPKNQYWYIGTRYVILAKHWIWLPGDGSVWTETYWSSFHNFNYFNNLRILSFVCISWTIKCLIWLMHGATMKLHSKELDKGSVVKLPTSETSDIFIAQFKISGWTHLTLLTLVLRCTGGWHYVVRTATLCGLEGPGIEFRSWQRFPGPSRLAQRSTQPPVHGVLRPFLGGKAAGAWHWPLTHSVPVWDGIWQPF